MNLWNFIQQELLGMQWLNRLMGSLVAAAGLDPAGRIGGSIQFFLYDTVKIMVLLGFLILTISYIQSYFPPERTKRILGRFHGLGANCAAALLGTVIPFCSCSFIWQKERRKQDPACKLQYSQHQGPGRRLQKLP